MTGERSRLFSRVTMLLAALCLCTWAGSAPKSRAQDNSSSPPSAKSAQPLVPSGTVLPVILRSTIHAATAKPGQAIRGEIAQDVPLPGGDKIRKGSKVEGQIVEVTPGTSSGSAKISMRFDKLYDRGKAIAVTTNLRAIAGFMDVMEAQTPTFSSGEGEVYDWLPTTQIGGDSVFGRGGPVSSAHNAFDHVGTAPMTGGVLVRLSANPEGHCRGEIDNNTSPQALWVFSSDACGTYGLSKVNISHAGRSEPIGTITLDMEDCKSGLRSGDGMLLRVIG